MSYDISNQEISETFCKNAKIHIFDNKIAINQPSHTLTTICT